MPRKVGAIGGISCMVYQVVLVPTEVSLAGPFAAGGYPVVRNLATGALAGEVSVRVDGVDRVGRVVIDEWRITVDVLENLLFISATTPPDVDAALQVDRLYRLAGIFAQAYQLECFDRELDQQIDPGVANPDQRAAAITEFAAQVERSKSPDIDIMPNRDTTHVPWPVLWGEYIPMDLAGGPAYASDLTRAEAKSRFEAITQNAAERQQMLVTLCARHGVNLTPTREGLEALGKWLVNSVESGTEYRTQLRHPWRLVLLDAAIYTAEVLLQRLPYLHWKLITTGGKSYIDYQEVVIAGFKRYNFTKTVNVISLVLSAGVCATLDFPVNDTRNRLHGQSDLVGLAFIEDVEPAT